MSERFEIRLSDEYRLKIRELAARYETTASDAVRRAIDEAHEEMEIAERRAAVARLLQMEVSDDVPDPEELSRQLDTTHDLPDLY
jgi:hypothetical protein